MRSVVIRVTNLSKVYGVLCCPELTQLMVDYRHYRDAGRCMYEICVPTVRSIHATVHTIPLPHRSDFTRL